jgi:hypothetical protein
MEAVLERPVSPAKLVVPALVGAAVAVALGVYGNVHDPTGKSILGDGLFFSATLNMKAWLATAVVLLACLQVFTATWMYEKLPFGARPWVPTVHKASGTLAFLVSLPVVYHCLWALGFQDTTTRVLIHSLAGCFFYGAFTAKMLWLRVDGLPGVVLPIVGGSVFTALVVIWLTSSLWFFDNIGFPSF